jgi:hypothetical protein
MAAVHEQARADDAPEQVFDGGLGCGAAAEHGRWGMARLLAASRGNHARVARHRWRWCAGGHGNVGAPLSA